MEPVGWEWIRYHLVSTSILIKSSQRSSVRQAFVKRSSCLRACACVHTVPLSTEYLRIPRQGVVLAVPKLRIALIHSGVGSGHADRYKGRTNLPYQTPINVIFLTFDLI